MTFNALKASLVMAPQPAVMLNPSGMVLLWNKAAADLFGWTGSETEGRPATFLTPAGRQALSSWRAKPDNLGQCLIACRCKDGREIALPMALIPIQGNDPEDHHCLCIVLKGDEQDQLPEDFRTISRSRLISAMPGHSQPDLRERLQFESLLSTISADLIKTRDSDLTPTLRKSLNAVRTFFAADNAILAFTIRKHQQGTRILTSQADYMEPAPEAASGLAPTALLHYLNRTPFFRFSHPRELPPDWTRERDLARRHGISSGLWIRLRTRDGHVGVIALNQREPGMTWSMDTAHRLQLFGEIMIGAMLRCHVERELAEAKTFQDTILDNLPVGVFVKNASDLTFAFMNRTARQLAGWDPAAAIAGRSNEEVFSPEDAAAFTAQDRKVLETLAALEIDRQAYTSSDGGTKVIRTRKVPVTDKDGNPRYLVGLIEDLTDRIASSTENAHLKQQLQRIRRSEALVQVAENFAHDLNNLLYGITGYTDLVKDMTDDQEILDYLDQVLTGARRASELVNRMQEQQMVAESENIRAESG